MGRAYSLMTATFSGVRVAGTLTYVPAHISNGKEVSARCVIPVYANSNKGTDQKSGEKGRSDSFKLVAWDHYADSCARSLPVGKALDVVTRPQSYMGRLFDQNGQVRVDVAGVPIMVEKVSFVILELNYGEESAKTIDEEIQTGRRPINWDKPNHPDCELWKTVLKNRQKLVWDGRSEKFEFARVSMPRGNNIIMKQAPAVVYAAPQAQNLPGLVENVLNGQQPLFDPMTGRPLVQQNRPLFDAMTGKPLVQQIAGFPGATVGFPTVGLPDDQNTVICAANAGQKLF
jgi:hypothetical protein